MSNRIPTFRLFLDTATPIVLLAVALITWKTKSISEQTHDSTNSKMDMLLELVGKEAAARGNLQGRDELLTEQIKASIQSTGRINGTLSDKVDKIGEKLDDLKQDIKKDP